jgi:hypothetical protein
MYIPKRYGESRIDTCPFCKQHATATNKQGVAVCIRHKNNSLPDMKCACGSYLELRNGKFGVYFSCLKCGNVSLSKALEMNDVEAPENKTITPAEPKEWIVRSDDPRFFS